MPSYLLFIETVVSVLCLLCVSIVSLLIYILFLHFSFSALIRPGRFDMQVTVPRPDVRGRTEILKWYLNKIKFDKCKSDSVIHVIISLCIPHLMP